MTSERPTSRPMFMIVGITTMVVFLFLAVTQSPLPNNIYRSIHYSNNCSHYDDYDNDEDADLLTPSELLALKLGVGSADPRLTAHPKYLRHLRSMMTSPPGGGHSLPLVAPSQTDWSQLNQSFIVDRLLRGRRNGFFVDCGANDGEWLSNSLFFELRRNWTGLLIEASPSFYIKLLKKNRNVYTFGGCLSSTGLPQMLPFRTDLFPYGVAGIASNLNASNSTETPAAAAIIPVFCVPLNDLLAAIGRNYVDYLSLDIEGAEPEVLEHVDWTTLRIDVMTVEHGYTKSLDRLRQIILGTGLYEEVQVVYWDVIFARKDFLNSSR